METVPLIGYFNLLYPYAWPFLYIISYLYHLLINTIAVKKYGHKEGKSFFERKIHIPLFSLYSAALSCLVLLLECGVLYLMQYAVMFFLSEDRFILSDFRFGFSPFYEWRMFLMFLPVFCLSTWIHYTFISMKLIRKLKSKEQKKEIKPMRKFISFMTAPWIIVVPVVEFLYLVAIAIMGPPNFNR
jgi:uncharacterized membrane protein